MLNSIWNGFKPFLGISFILSQALDIFSTYIALVKFNFIEINPVAVSLFANIGFINTLLVKAIIAMIILFVFDLIRFKFSHYLKPFEYSLFLGHIFTWQVVALNFTGITAVFLRST